MRRGNQFDFDKVERPERDDQLAFNQASISPRLSQKPLRKIEIDRISSSYGDFDES